ncbi:hypothetical protein ACQF4J_44290 [Streptomyces sp. C1-1]|uniref:hypothetical protein n=1 Tax=Streptomyces sp. C1-1 TaxID=3231173 RepID=UPI003D0772C7
MPGTGRNAAPVKPVVSASARATAVVEKPADVVVSGRATDAVQASTATAPVDATARATVVVRRDAAPSVRFMRSSP